MNNIKVTYSFLLWGEEVNIQQEYNSLIILPRVGDGYKIPVEWYNEASSQIKADDFPKDIIFTEKQFRESDNEIVIVEKVIFNSMYNIEIFLSYKHTHWLALPNGEEFFPIPSSFAKSLNKYSVIDSDVFGLLSPYFSYLETWKDKLYSFDEWILKDIDILGSDDRISYYYNIEGKK